MENKVQIFEDKKVRTLWDDTQEKWYFSIVDVVEVLTESPNPRKYWSVLKLRLKKEGSQLTTNCSQLKMKSSDGKFYKTDVVRYRATIPLNTIHSVVQSRAFQTLDCPSGRRTPRRDARPRTDD